MKSLFLKTIRYSYFLFWLLNAGHTFAQIDNPSTEASKQQEDATSIVQLKTGTTDYLDFLSTNTINTIASEFGGVFYDQGILFVAESNRLEYSAEMDSEGDYGSYDLFYIPFDGINFGLRKPIAGNINTDFQEGPFFIYGDGKKMIYTKSIPNEDLESRQLVLMKAVLSKKSWKSTDQVKIETDGNSIGHAVINQNENRIIFTGRLHNSFGDTDLYYCDKLKNGKWSHPKNLGKRVNTKGKECFPTMIDDENLIYSSNGFQDSNGGLDLYALNIADIEHPIVLRLGDYINSTEDDFHLTFSKDNKLGMFSSNRKDSKGSDDIFIFRVDKNMRFFAATKLRIEIRDLLTELPIEKTHIQIINQDLKKNLLNDRSNKDGEVNCDVDLSTKKIKIKATKKGFYPYSEEISIQNINPDKPYIIWLDPM